MYNVYDFIAWALSHADPNTILKSSNFPIAKDKIGTEPWHYLFGTVKVHTNQYWLNERFNNYYSAHGWTREEYDKVTGSWLPEDWATDCQGLLDAWMTYEAGEKTDINAQMNYVGWCTDKGKISEIDRPYVIGEALFAYSSSSKKMTHVGWVCGFTDSGDVLAVEARGIRSGVVITKMSDRSWTHRGLMTTKFDYTEPKVEPYVFSLQRPHLKGDECALMQDTLNRLGYRTSGGDTLEVDGNWGPLSQSVLETFIELNKPEEIKPVVVDQWQMSEGGYTITVTKDAQK